MRQNDKKVENNIFAVRRAPEFVLGIIGLGGLASGLVAVLIAIIITMIVANKLMS